MSREFWAALGWWITGMVQGATITLLIVAYLNSSSA